VSVPDLVGDVDDFVVSLLKEADSDKQDSEGGPGADHPAFLERVNLLKAVTSYLAVRNGLEDPSEKAPAQIDQFTDELAAHRTRRKIGRRTPGPAPRP
jgi:hypothetical protein